MQQQPEHHPFPTPKEGKFTFIDLFAGVGGFHMALQNIGGVCLFASEFNKSAQETYRMNYGESPHGDIKLKEAARSLNTNRFR